jgi:SNF2 family DNA or RNA helicase
MEFIWENLVNKKRGCLLAHWMGLGKTFQVITFLQAYVTAFGMSSRFLILAPVCCLRSWKAEFEKWLGAENNEKVNPYVSVRILTGILHLFFLYFCFVLLLPRLVLVLVLFLVLHSCFSSLLLLPDCFPYFS